MSVRINRRPIVCVLVLGALAVTACSSTPHDVGELTAPTPAGSAPAAAAPSPSPTHGAGDGGAQVDLDAAFRERDRFFRDQQQPVGGATLRAKTPAQREFIAQQRARVEARGVRWTPDAETVSLAVTLDACETAILQGHRLSAEVMRLHVATDPLFPRFAGDDPRAISGLAETMVFGTTFLCPDDAPGWQAAFDEVYGGSQRT